MESYKPYWTSSRRTSRRRLLQGSSLAALGTIGATLLGCGGDDDDAAPTSNPDQTTPEPTSNGGSEPRQGGEIVFADDQDVGTLDPLFSNVAGRAILTATHSRLVSWKHGADVGQWDHIIEADRGVATDWEQPDEQTYVFNLKPDVSFHDKAPVNGRTLTAEDVVYTFELWRDSGRSAQAVRDMASVRAIDAQTVEFKTNSPYVPFLQWIASSTNVILAPEAGNDGDYSDLASVIGTGPFMFESYEPGFKVRTVRNPSYFVEGEPYLDAFELRPIPDKNAVAAAVRTGEVDIGWYWWQGLDPSLAESLLRDNTSLTSYDDWTPGSPFFITAKVDRPPFNDPRVRQAVSLAVNREQWIDLLAEGHGLISGAAPYQFPDKWYLWPDDLNEHYIRHDLAEAKKLLEAAGYGDGIDINRFLSYARGSNAMPETELIVEQMKQVGINLTIDQPEYLAMIDQWLKGEFEFAWTTTSYSSDWDTSMYGHWHSSGFNAAEGNRYGINDPELDELMDRQRVTFDEEERTSIIHQSQQLNARECYMIYEVARLQHMPFPKDVRNFGPHSNFDGGGIVSVMWRDA